MIQGIPAIIKVADAVYEIVVWNSNSAMSARRYGECSASQKIIKVDAAYGEYQFASTLLHEILHAICAEYHREDLDTEERTVGFIETGIMQVMLDNPVFAAFMHRALVNQRAAVRAGLIHKQDSTNIQR